MDRKRSDMSHPIHKGTCSLAKQLGQECNSPRLLKHNADSIAQPVDFLHPILTQLIIINRAHLLIYNLGYHSII